MKNIKKILATATFCAATVVGYNVYNNATMTEEERLMKANLEALSDDEATYIPCYVSSGDTCSFDFVNAFGEVGLMTISNHAKVD